MSRHYTLCVYTENSPGVLHRITTMFTRRKLNIESLTVSETEQKGISRFTIALNTDPQMLRKVVRQINRVIEVVDVFAADNDALVFCEVALFRVHIGDNKTRGEIEDLIHRYGASIARADESDLIIEKAGTEEEVRSLYHLLKPFGIKEFLRSGRIAMLKGERENGRELFIEDEPPAAPVPSDV